MADLSPLPEGQKYRVVVSAGRNFVLSFLRNSNRLLVFLGLRSKRKYWGVVYDSVTKQPLDPAIVKIAYAQELDSETCVTDLSGKYGFFAHPGRFKLLAKKTNYSFPSKLVPGDKDGIYEHLYHGEFFELKNDYEVVAPNIPMDPVNFDWNQQAKLGVIRAHPYRAYLLERLIAIFFWFGFILDGLYIWGHFAGDPIFAYVIAAVYGLLIFLALFTAELRLWGRFSQHVFSEGEILLELENPELPGVVFGRSLVTVSGKFLLRANKGKYNLAVKYKDKTGEVITLGTVPVSINAEGVLNTTVRIRS